MEFLPENIDAYASNHTDREADYLHQLHRETYLNVLRPRMLSGHLHFELSPYENQIEAIVTDAMDFIPSIQEEIDLVFIDADKENYLAYYQMLLPKIRKGGYIIADNVLWSGKVAEPVKDKDLETKALIEFNEFVQNDPQVENILLPLRDGLMIARKK